WNRENRIQGGVDIPLNERGKEQARDIALRLTHTVIRYIYSSRLSRALETAIEIAKFHKLEVLTDSRLDLQKKAEETLVPYLKENDHQGAQ
ncbi:unnamed protein product, partial [marine sediment metagenome]